MDTGTHLRAIWHRRWWVLGAALLAGALVFALRASAAPTYTAEATLFLVAGDAPRAGEDAEVDRLTAAYAELLNDEPTVLDAVRRYGRPLTPEEVRERVDVLSAEDGQLVLAATGDSPTEAAALANAAGDAFSAGGRRDQAEQLRRELAPLNEELAALDTEIAALPDGGPAADRLEERRARLEEARAVRLSFARARLDVVRRAQVTDVQRTPDAARDALLAFLLVLIVAAELAALRAARRQGLEGRDRAEQLEQWTGLPVFRTGVDGQDQGAAALRFVEADEERGHVLYLPPLDPGPATELGTARLLQAVALHPTPMWVDLAEEPSTVAAPAGVAVRRPALGELTALAAGVRRGSTTVVTTEAWESPALLRLAELLPGTCLLLVDARQARRPHLEEALRVLAYAGLPVTALLLVETSGRLRRRRSPEAVATAPADASAAAA